MVHEERRRRRRSTKGGGGKAAEKTETDEKGRGSSRCFAALLGPDDCSAGEVIPHMLTLSLTARMYTQWEHSTWCGCDLCCSPTFNLHVQLYSMFVCLFVACPNGPLMLTCLCVCGLVV